MIRILDPTHGAAPETRPQAPRPASLAGATIGIVSNGKEGTKAFFAHLGRLLEQELGVREVALETKSSYSAPADRAILDEARRWDAAVTGIGD